MGLRDRLRAGFDAVFSRQAAPASVIGQPGLDLPLWDPPVRAVEGEVVTETLARREVATVQANEARAQLQAYGSTQESIGLGMGMSLDQDDHQYRRLTTGAKAKRRDLSPLQHDRALEVCWWLWEQNALARRMITLMTDLILGDGLKVEATDERIQDEVNLVWNHPTNPLKDRIQEFHNSLAVNGELIIPVTVHPVTGRITYGFLDPYQVKDVVTLPDNILVPDYLVLKTEAGQEEKRLKIVRANEQTGKLEGEVFFLGVNKLPNSLRGRPDLMPLADWLDLYDQYLFAEVERLHLLSAFVWDYKIEGADAPAIKDKLSKFPTPRPGSVWAHNEKETLEARTPDLKAADRSEAGRMLRTHIAGSYGFPLSYLGEIDSNKASIEGQNDVMMKTPAARQKVFGAFIGQIVQFAIDSTTTKNPALFDEADRGFQVRMPEIQAKDIARAGSVLASVVGAMDTAMANRTTSRKTASVVIAALLKHLGIDVDPQDMLDEADLDAEERQAMADAIQGEVARQRAAGLIPDEPAKGPKGQTNPPAGSDPDGDE